MGMVQKVMCRCLPVIGTVQKVEYRCLPVIGTVQKVEYRCIPVIGTVQEVMNGCLSVIGVVNRSVIRKAIRQNIGAHFQCGLSLLFGVVVYTPVFPPIAEVALEAIVNN